MTVEDAIAALTEARAKRNQLVADDAAASSALTAATSARSAMVKATAEGNPPTDAQHRKVEADIQAAKHRAGLLAEAVKEADAAVTRGEAALHQAQQAAWEARMAAAIEGRVTAAARLDQAVAAARAALAEFDAAGIAVNGLTSEGAGYKTPFHRRIEGLLLLRGVVLRPALELTIPDGVGGRKPIHASVEAMERGGWRV